MLMLSCQQMAQRLLPRGVNEQVESAELNLTHVSRGGRDVRAWRQGLQLSLQYDSLVVEKP